MNEEMEYKSLIDDSAKRQRGFATIATGNPKYYKLAVNLLYSYKVNGKASEPFAIICDKVCPEVFEFDDIVLIDNPTNSYLDKLYLYKYIPYNETIFIDADSLILAPVDNIWDDFGDMGDFSCYGKKLPVDSRKGWFFWDGMRELKEKLDYNVSMHGGLYYLRKTVLCENVFNWALNLAQNFKLYSFAQFKKPADEPVLACSMCLSNLEPCDKKRKIIFFPDAEGNLSADYNGRLRFNGKYDEVPILHFGNIHTERYMYQFLSFSINSKISNKNFTNVNNVRLYFYKKYFFIEIKFFIRRILRKIVPRKLVYWLRPS